MTAPPVLAADGVGLRFGPVQALAGVALAAQAGQVLCLLGDNGAGKSSLIKVLSGVVPPDAGEVRVDGRPVSLGSPRDARRLGVATVYQDLALVPLMSVWRNFFLGSEPVRRLGPLRWLDAAHCRRMALEELAELGIRLRDADQLVGTLSGGQRQALAIARALHFGARALILDEPTAALGVRQSVLVLELVRRAAARGAAVLLVTHNPAHAAEVGDRFVVLRQGRVAARLERGEASAEALMRWMAGEEAGPDEGGGGDVAPNTRAGEV